jgi:hypothetical protein
LKKGGVVEKKGEEETKSMPHAPVNNFGDSFYLFVFVTELKPPNKLFLGVKRIKTSHKKLIRN